MLSAIVQDLITKEEEYLYLKIENNNLIYYGYSIQNRNVKQIDRDIINKIYNLLRVNENCVYIEDYQDYKVYLDKDNNIKHYLKNGVEDFFMLFKNNGEDSNLYLKIEYENISKNSNSKKFKIGNKILRITLESLKSFIIGILIGTVIVGVVNDTPRTVKHEINNLIYSTYQAFNLDVEAIDTYQAYQLINESKLPLSTKQSLNNKDLLDDVFPYYEDTNMQYSIKNRLKDLQLDYYDNYKTSIENRNIVGYYNILQPNIIHIRKDVNASQVDEVAEHEFVHLLQSNTIFTFLKEACAEIISSEYFNRPCNSYKYAIANTKLLMDVIGPKVIWETIFGEDDTKLKNILKNNLSDSDYKELTEYLFNEPLETKDSCDKINELISRLYMNINLSDIKQDRNIYDQKGNHIVKCYFNERVYCSNYINYSIEDAKELNLVDIVYDELYINEITKDKYKNLFEQLQNNPEYQKLQNDLLEESGMLDYEYYNRKIIKIKNIAEKYFPLKDGVEIVRSLALDYVRYNKDGIVSLFSIDEALNYGLISAKYYEVINGENITNEEKQGYELYCRIVSQIYPIDDTIIVNYDENNIPINISKKYIISIKDMFPDQAIRKESDNIVR